jgi:hypothetical protein
MLRLALAAVLVLACAGCAWMRRPGPMDDGARTPLSPEEFARLRERYNARCRDLERLKTSVSLTVEGPDGKGGRRKDQAEGFFQFVAPSRVSLRVDKMGQTLAILGSDEQRYWWIELGEQKVVLEGTHAAATPVVGARFGIPVHPLDFVGVLGIVPLGLESVCAGRSRDGLVRVDLPPRGNGWGGTRLYVHEEWAGPAHVEVLDAAGRVALRADLSTYVPVKVSGDTFSPARIASRLVVELPGQDAVIRVALPTPENPRDAMRTAPFDLERLLEAYGVDQRVNLDIERGM